MARIALYPGPLLAQVLTASTYWNQIHEADDWADRHSDPNLLYVPDYDALIVFAPPRPGFAIAGAIHFGPGITIGAAFDG